MFCALHIFYDAAKQTWNSSFRPISRPFNCLAGEVVASVAPFLWNNGLLSRDLPQLSSRGHPDVCIGLGLNVNSRGGNAQQDGAYWLVFHLYPALMLKVESQWTDMLTWHALLGNYLSGNYMSRKGELFVLPPWTGILFCGVISVAVISIKWTELPFPVSCCVISINTLADNM